MRLRWERDRGGDVTAMRLTSHTISRLPVRRVQEPSQLLLHAKEPATK